MNKLLLFLKTTPIFLLSVLALIIVLFFSIFNIINSDGHLVKNKFGYYYFTDRQNNIIKNEEINYNGHSIYIDEYGQCLRNSFYNDMYFDENGYKLVNTFHKIGDSTFFLDENGKVVYNKWINFNNKNYYADEYGAILKNMWINNKYYVGNDGELLVNTTTPDGSIVNDKGEFVFNDFYNFDKNTIKIGDEIKFGKYYQNLKEKKYEKNDIDWIVLENDNGKIKLISKNILDCCEYNHKNENINWENSSLRSWLNNEFLREAFSRNDIEMLAPSINYDLDNKNKKINETLDKIFILSKEEINNYFSTAKNNYDNIKSKATEYAMRDSLYVDFDYSNYWLRDQSSNKSFASYVQYDGKILVDEALVSSNNIGVRPCIFIDLNKK